MVLQSIQAIVLPSIGTTIAITRFNMGLVYVFVDTSSPLLSASLQLFHIYVYVVIACAHMRPTQLIDIELAAI